MRSKNIPALIVLVALVLLMTAAAIPLLGAAIGSATGTYYSCADDEAVTNISVEPGNGQNEVSWLKVGNIEYYRVYRRVGKDASATRPELNKYVLIGSVTTAPDRYSGDYQFTNPVFVDHYAKNGTTYSYIVLADAGWDIYEGTPSKSVCATPRSGKRAKPAAPYDIDGYSYDGEGGIEWSWDAKGGQEDPDTGENDHSSGEGYIDHFNVYRNGRLLKQVKQNGVKPRDVYGTTYYEWETEVSFGRDDADYTFWVTAVDSEGNESVPGEMYVLSSMPERDLCIESHAVTCYGEDIWDDSYDNVIGNCRGLAVHFDTIGTERIELWRKPVGTSDSRYSKVTLTEGPDGTEVDTGVERDKVYTYKAIGHGYDGRVTEPYCFSAAADFGDDSYYSVPGGRPFGMRLRSYDGESATVDIDHYGTGTYRLYRDGRVINTWSNSSGNITYTDSPGADGEYKYYFTWTSKQYPSLTVTSRTVVFCKDTSDVDEDELEKAPGAPRLVGRVREGGDGQTVTMNWSPSKSGGKPDGYIIYRTDGGIPNTHMWKNTWSHPLRDEEANGRYISRPADATQFDMRIAWKESDYAHVTVDDYKSPHILWVVAYNDLGMSEPSNPLVYESTDGEPPVNEDTDKPGAPENVSARCEWKDEKGELGWLDGRLHINWAAPSTGGTVDYYKYKITGSNGKVTSGKIEPGDYSPNALEYSIGGNEIESGVEYTIVISAVNDKGEVAAAPVKITAENSFAFKAEAASSTSASLSWSALKDPADVSEFCIWRRANKSKWEKIITVSGNAEKRYTDTGLEMGTTYEYYMTAADVNGATHRSVTREVTTTSRTDGNNAPTEFSARAVDGDVILNWTPPQGGLPTYYVLEYQTMDKSPTNDNDWSSIELKGDVYGNTPLFRTEAFGNSTGAVIMSWEYAGTGYSRYSDFRNLRGKKILLRVRACGYRTGYSPASNMIEFTWPAESSISHASRPPKPITPTVVEGDDQITLRWNKRTNLESGESEATFYQLVRIWDNKSVIFTIPAVPGKTSYEFVDMDTDVQNGRQYTYELRPCSSYHYMDSYYNEYWYDPLCYMHQVTATPNGPTVDQKVANNISTMFAGLISSKPNPLTNDYCRQVLELKDNYEGLSSYQKKLIGSETCGQIEALINEVTAFLSQEEYGEDQEVLNVKTEIAAIDPDAVVTEAYETKVSTARANYDALPEAAKSLIDNYSILTRAEAHIKQVKREAADQAKADALSTKLLAINVEAIRALTSDTLTDEQEREIANLRWEYDSMTKAQQAKVSKQGLQKLEEAEAAINDILGIDHVHSLKEVAAEEATCKDKGNIKYYKCSKCGKYFLDAAGATEITDKTAVEIPTDPTKHVWSEWSVKKAATCTTGGMEEHSCKLCGAKEERSFEARDHKWDAGTIDDSSPATDGEGKTYYPITFHCQNCSETKSGKIYPGGEDSCPAGAHVWDKGTVTKTATCTENGELKYTCVNCTTSVKYETQVDPLAHVWGDWASVEGKEATCTSSGSSERTCTLCHEKEIRIDTALGHDWHQSQHDEHYVAPTCGTAGQMTAVCSRCEATSIEVIPATGRHTYGEWKVTVEPTCTEAGVKVRECSVCHNVEFAPADPKGHAWDGGRVTKQPAVGVKGVRTYTCTRCGKTRTESIAALPQPYVAPAAPAEIQDLPYVKASKPAKGKKAITVKWKKVKKKNQKKIGGIEIQVTGPGVNMVVTAGKKKSSKKIKGLMPKQKYSCRVRAYNYIGGVKHVSAWSNWKTAKTK
ncbi:MAG: hypothetical protein E7219_03680 [Clostridiales bacterium]|nr:hypothetical protein [Clostridiales bacterium]